MRKRLSRIGIDEFEKITAGVKGVGICPLCKKANAIEYGGEFNYEGSDSKGVKYRCLKCGSKGIAWYVLEFAEWEVDDPSTIDFDSNEENQPIDENY